MKKRFIAMLGAILLLVAPASAQWVTSANGGIPVTDGPTGRDTDGQVLFVCRAWYGGGLSPGKIRAGFGGCLVGWAGRERTVPRYAVLGGGRFGWENVTGGRVRDFAIVAGREANGEPLFVCRAWHRNGMHPGKVRRGFNGCNITYGGDEIRKQYYEVLVVRW